MAEDTTLRGNETASSSATSPRRRSERASGLRAVRRRDDPRGPGPHRAARAADPADLPGCARRRHARSRSACRRRDNWMIHVAVEQCQDGDILWSRRPSPSDAGYFGDLLATALSRRGVRGLVIDAGCRDVAELTQMGFPVWSRCMSATGHREGDARQRQRSRSCAPVSGSTPGDVIVADDDGVVVVPRAEAAEVLEASRRREEKEAASRGRYRRGELSLDVHGMRERLARQGPAIRRPGGDERGSRPPSERGRPDDHRLPRALHDDAGRAPGVPRRAAGPARRSRASPSRRPAAISDDEIRESIESNQLRLLRERGGDLMIFSPKASAHGAPRARPATARAWARGVQRPRPPGRGACSPTTSPGCASCRRPRRPARRRDRRAAAVRRGARLRRLQPEP